jgi:hypothetical protein
MKTLLSALVILALCTSLAGAQNLAKNPGFEDPTVNTGSALGNWFRFGSGPNGSANESTDMPHGGTRHISLETIGAQQFAGVFQLLEDPASPGTPLPVAPGETVTFSGWHMAVGLSNQTSEIKLEWQGAPQNRLDVINIAVGQYTQFTHTGVAPPGTTGLVVTYAISTFGPGQNSNTRVYIDDFQVVIPEPATMSGLGLIFAGLARIRRREHGSRA